MATTPPTGVTVEALQGSLDVPALFDAVLKTLQAKLEGEFDANRLRGTDYSKVYLGSMEAVLGNTVQYLLGSALLDVQKRKIEADIEVTKLQGQIVELEKQKLHFQVTELLPLEKSKMQMETDALSLQVDKLRYEYQELLPLTKDKTRADVDFTQAQASKARFEVSDILPLEKDKTVAEVAVATATADKMRFEVAELLPLLKTKTVADVDLTIAQAQKLQFEVSDILPLEKTKVQNETRALQLQADKLQYEKDFLLPLQRDTLTVQKDKVAAETTQVTAQIPLINAQTKQITDTLADTIRKMTAEADLIVAKAAAEALQPQLVQQQIALFKAQSEGFAKEHEYKFSKLYADMFAVMFNSDETVQMPDALHVTNADSVIKKSANNLGFTLTIPIPKAPAKAGP